MATATKTKSATQTNPKPAAKRGRKATGQHTARLEFRLSDEAKAKIEIAAMASGQSISDFASSVLLREANDVLDKQHRTTLSERDWERFVELLTHPPELSPATKKGIDAYKKHSRVEGDVTFVSTAIVGELPEEWQGDPH